MSRITEPEVLDLLTRLVEKSLVVYEEDENGNGRYRLTETVKQYARDRLLEAGEAAPVRRRHAAWYLELVEADAPKLWGSDSPSRLEQLQTEHDNLRTALGWGADNQPELVLRLAGPLQTFWDDAGHVSEGYAWLKEALAAGRHCDPALRARASRSAAWLAVCLGEHSAARATLDEALAILRDLGDDSELHRALGIYAHVLQQQGDYDGARSLLEERLSLQRASGDLLRIVAALEDLGFVIALQGDYPAARALCDEALTLVRSMGHVSRLAWCLLTAGHVARWEGKYLIAVPQYEAALRIFEERRESRGIAHAHLNLGHLALFAGDHSGARAHYQQALHHFEQRDGKVGIALSLGGLGMLAVAEAQPVRAGRLLGAADTLRETIRVQLAPPDRPPYERAVADARATLGDEAFAAAWAAGRTMTLEQATAYALEERHCGGFAAAPSG